MTIPLLKNFQDCGDYAHTVEPFKSEFYELPQRLLETGGSLSALQQLYADTNPLVSGFAASIFLGAIFLVVSEINRNYSQVDRMWSILPNLYIVHIAVWARAAGLPHSRIDLIAVFTTLWSIRLTFNYWRKGGYNVGSEDYRWEILQRYVPRFVWFIFNVTFISFIQSVLLFLFSCPPAYAILLTTQFDPEVTQADVAYFLVGIGLVVSEWFSDGQMWTYQTAKHQYQKDAKVPQGFKQEDLDRGFITSGLWAYSRHPNFFAEQSICWTGIGSGLLVLLFQGSTWLTEGITAGKYPEYNEYQNQVGMFCPKSLSGYEAPLEKPGAQKPSAQQPKVIRTSELLKRYQEKEKQK